MARQALAILMGPQALHAVALRRAKGRPLLLRAWELPLAGDHALPQALHQLATEAAEFGKCHVAFLPTPASVYLHDFEIDLSDREDIERVLPFEVEDDFPEPVSDLSLDIAWQELDPEGRSRVHVAGVNEADLRAATNHLSAAGLQPQLAGAPAAALLAALREVPGELPASWLAVARVGHHLVLAARNEGRLVLLRHLAVIAPDDPQALGGELRLSWEIATGTPLGAEVPVYLTRDASDPVADALAEELPGPLHALDLPVSDPGPRSLLCGLAAAALAEEEDTLNFLTVQSRHRAARQGVQYQALILCAVLLALAGTLVGERLYRLHHLQQRKTALQTEMDAIYQQVLPEGPPLSWGVQVQEVVRAVEELREQRKALAAVTQQGVPVHQVLALLGRSMPRDGEKALVELRSFRLRNATVEIEGRAPSHELPRRFQERLQASPMVRQAVMRRGGSEARTGDWRFSMELNLATAEEPPDES